MRLLVTGMTPQHINSQDRDGKYANNWDMMSQQALPALGHEITWRETTPGEDLRGFDVAVVGVHALNGLQTLRYKHGAVWAMSQLPSLIVTNDARYHDVWRSMEHTAAFWKCAHMSSSHQRRFNAALKHSKVIDKARYNLHVGNYVGLIPRWKRIGSLDPLYKINKTKELLSWDPTPFLGVVQRFNPNKTEQWVVAALRNLDWFVNNTKHTWPVVGPHKPWIKKTIPKGVESNGWRLIQQEVLDLYLESAGALVFPYDEYTSNTGWFRTSYLFATANGCPFHVGGNEYADYGPEFSFDPEDIENLSASDRQALADTQFNTLMSIVDTRDASLKDLQYALDRAIQRGPLV